MNDFILFSIFFVTVFNLVIGLIIAVTIVYFYLIFKKINIEAENNGTRLYMGHRRISPTREHLGLRLAYENYGIIPGRLHHHQRMDVQDIPIIPNYIPIHRRHLTPDDTPNTPYFIPQQYRTNNNNNIDNYIDNRDIDNRDNDNHINDFFIEEHDVDITGDDTSNDANNDTPNVNVDDNINAANNSTITKCVVCQDEDATYLIVDCNHKILCRKCTYKLKFKRMNTCPICRHLITICKGPKGTSDPQLYNTQETHNTNQNVQPDYNESSNVTSQIDSIINDYMARVGGHSSPNAINRNQRRNIIGHPPDTIIRRTPRVNQNNNNFNFY